MHKDMEIPMLAASQSTGGSKTVSGTCPMTQQQLIELYFLDVRAKLLDIAAFLDRMDRSVEHNAGEDFRMVALRSAMQALCSQRAGRVYTIQMLLSDPSSEPLPQLDRKSAFGAFNTQREPVK